MYTTLSRFYTPDWEWVLIYLSYFPYLHCYSYLLFTIGPYYAVTIQSFLRTRLRLSLIYNIISLLGAQKWPCQSNSRKNICYIWYLLFRWACLHCTAYLFLTRFDMILTKPLLHAFVDGLRGSHSASLSVHIQSLDTPDETWVWKPKSGWVSIKQILVSMTYPWGCAALKPTMDSSFRAHNPFFHIATNTSIFLPYHVSVVVATCWKCAILTSVWLVARACWRC